MMVAELRKIDRRSGPQLRSIETRVTRDEDREAWGRVYHLTGRGHLSVVAERPDLSLASFGEIRSIATRRLRQLGGDGAA